MRSFIAAAGAVLIALAGALPAAGDDAGQLAAQQAGQRVHDDLEARGEILPPSTRLYGALDPIARRIETVADPDLDVPLQFVLLHQPNPNAFAVPGGTVYVTDSLFHFVRNADELAAVLCHETAHEIHHDAQATDAQSERVATIANVVGAVTRLNRTVAGVAGENVAYKLETDRFSRDVERRADFKGAMTCAAAGFNPWGMVWLFRSFESADSGGALEPLSDHPTDAQRISDLEDEFSSYPQIFDRFSPDIRTAAQF